MKKMLALSIILTAVVLLHANASYAQMQAGRPAAAEGILCHFRGIEKTDPGSEFVLSISGNAAEFSSSDPDNDKKVLKSEVLDNSQMDNDDLESLKKVLRENLQILEGGEYPYASPSEVETFLEVERPYYKAIDQIETATIYIFDSKHFPLQTAWALYDKDGNSIGMYAIGRQVGIFNFCTTP